MRGAGIRRVQTRRIAFSFIRVPRVTDAKSESLVVGTREETVSVLHAIVSVGDVWDGLTSLVMFGRGVMIDHATSIVVGETAVIGDGCTLFHGVTLGGTGKTRGDRHPKLGKRVVVGNVASILGNVKVADDCKIGSSAVLVHDVPPLTIVGTKGKVLSGKYGSALRSETLRRKL